MGRQIGEEVRRFRARVDTMLHDATTRAEPDRVALDENEQRVRTVIGRVSGALEALNRRAIDTQQLSQSIRTEVESMMVAFQFEDRVRQIIDQVPQAVEGISGHMHTADVQTAARTRRLPSDETWAQPLASGCSTQEQQSSQRPGRQGACAGLGGHLLLILRTLANAMKRTALIVDDSASPWPVVNLAPSCAGRRRHRGLRRPGRPGHTRRPHGAPVRQPREHAAHGRLAFLKSVKALPNYR